MEIVPKKKWEYPIAIEREYAKYLVEYVRQEMKIVESFLPEMGDAVYRNGIHRTDGVLDWLGNLVDKVQRKVKQKLTVLPILDKIFKQTDRFVSQQMAESTKSVFGVELKQPSNTRKYEMTKTIWVSQNTTLIKSIDDQIMEKIRYSLSQKIISTANKEQTIAALAKDIQEIARVSENRAVLIATDQVGKLNSQLMQYRQVNAGVYRYIWVTMNDKRVRPAHAARHGVSYRWDNPPDGGHPGWAIRCRCVAQPMYNLDSFKLTPKPNSFTKVDKNAIIKSKLEYIMEQEHIAGKLIYPPPEIDLSGLNFDNHHINDERSHGVTAIEAKQFIKDASFAIHRKGFGSMNFIGKNGAAYVLPEDKLIRTAFKRAEFIPQLEKMMEVVIHGD